MSFGSLLFISGRGPHVLRLLLHLPKWSPLNNLFFRLTPLSSSFQILHHEILQADLLAPLLPRLLHSVDLLVFNPPYVPTPTSEVGSHGIEASWAGGKDGREVLDRILDSIPNLLRPQGGCMYLVAVNENLPEDICARMREENLQAEVC